MSDKGRKRQRQRGLRVLWSSAVDRVLREADRGCVCVHAVSLWSWLWVALCIEEAFLEAVELVVSS